MSHQGHILRLHVRREAGIFLRHDVLRPDIPVAAYRQAVLTGFQQVEDNIAALRILESEAQVQDEAVKAAQQTVAVFTNQYKAGIVNYLAVIVAQPAALTNERAAITIMGNRFTAAVLLIKALGGGWKVSDLPASP